MNFEFATAQRILFGRGALAQAAPEAAALGQRALVVTGRSETRCRPLLDALQQKQIEPVRFAATGEPTVHDVHEAIRQARDARCDLVIAFGGGSVIDLAKAAAALLTNPGPLPLYLEVIGEGRPLVTRPAPCIAIPTTAGTGSEVTRNAVLTSPEDRVKVSLRHPWLIPTVAIVDPECTVDMPPDVTASSGLDALTQLLEAFLSRKANPITDGFCREGLPRAIRSLQKAVENGTDPAAREDMSLASLFSGLALAHAGLGAVHGFSSPIGGMTGAPHGMICASLLPHVMRANLHALRERQPGSPALERLAEFGRMTGGANASEGIEWLERLCRRLCIPPLASLGLTRDPFDTIVSRTQRASSMKTNPIELNQDELATILRQAF